MEKEIITMEELSEYLRISVHTLYKLSQKGKLPGRKIGKQWRYVKTEIDKWLRGNLGYFDV